MKALRSAWLGALLLAASAPALAATHDDHDHEGDAERSLSLDRDPPPGFWRKRLGESADPEATIRARQHFFGFENVDARNGRVRDDKVILSWFSVSSLAAAVRGRIILLDAYIFRRADKPAYVPTTLQELVELRPEAIFIGHGHFDHADLAANIAVRTGATIVGAAEHCDAMRADAANQFGAGTAVKCISAVSAGSAPGAEVVNLALLRPDLCVTAFKHVHSARLPADPTLPPNPINPIRDPRVDTLFPPQPAPADGVRTLGSSGPGGPLSMMYQFRVAGSDFTFVWHDTSGPLKEQAPQVLQLLATLPKTDVELGAVVSIGETTNGVRDPVTYIDAIQPKVFYMLHTDNFNIGASLFYLQAIQRQFDIIKLPLAERPEIRGFHDPYDYLRPGLATFDFRDKAWSDLPRSRAGMQSRKAGGQCRGF